MRSTSAWTTQADPSEASFGKGFIVYFVAPVAVAATAYVLLTYVLGPKAERWKRKREAAEAPVLCGGCQVEVPRWNIAEEPTPFNGSVGRPTCWKCVGAADRYPRPFETKAEFMKQQRKRRS